MNNYVCIYIYVIKKYEISGDILKVHSLAKSLTLHLSMSGEIYSLTSTSNYRFEELFTTILFFIIRVFARPLLREIVLFQ